MSYCNVKIKDVQIITITPKIAETMLKNNDGNRKISPVVVRKYIKDMKAGEWRETSQGMAVDETGKILDGQHRLVAVTKSGVSIVTTLTTFYGSVPTIMVPIDIGKNRRTANICGNGVNSRHIGLFNAIKAITKNYDAIMDANLVFILKKQLDPTFDFIAKTIGISIPSNKAPNAPNGICRIWSNGVKCAITAAVLSKKSIAIVKEFKNEEPKSICCKDYLEWDYEMRASGMGGGAERIITDAETFWGILAHKTFYPPKKYDKHIELRDEMQKIFNANFNF